MICVLFHAMDEVDHLVNDGVRLKFGSPRACGAYNEELCTSAEIDNELSYAGCQL